MYIGSSTTFPNYIIKNTKNTLYILQNPLYYKDTYISTNNNIEQNKKAISIYKMNIEINELNQENISVIFPEDELNTDDLNNNYITAFAIFGIISIQGVVCLLYLTNSDYNSGINDKFLRFRSIKNIHGIVLFPEMEKTASKCFHDSIYDNFKKYLIYQKLYFSNTSNYRAHINFDSHYAIFRKNNLNFRHINTDFCFNSKYCMQLKDNYFTPIIKGFFKEKKIIFDNQKAIHFSFVIREKNYDDDNNMDNKNKFLSTSKSILMEIEVYCYEYFNSVENIFHNILYYYITSNIDFNFLNNSIKLKNNNEKINNGGLIINIVSNKEENEKDFISKIEDDKFKILFINNINNNNKLISKVIKENKNLIQEIGYNHHPNYMSKEKISYQKKLLLIICENTEMLYYTLKKILKILIEAYLRSNSLFGNNFQAPLNRVKKNYIKVIIDDYKRETEINNKKIESITYIRNGPISYNNEEDKITDVNYNNNSNNNFFIFLLTYNLCGLNANDVDDIDFDEILFPKEATDNFTDNLYPSFYCIALEEVVELNTVNILIKSNKDSINLWVEKISNYLQKKYNYILQFKGNLVSVLFLIYIKASECKFITNIKKEIVKKGFFGQTGNKGYVIYNFTYKDNNFGFSGGHLISGEKEKEYYQRKLDFIEILNSNTNNGFEFYKNDFYFILGDLNFRVNKNKSTIKLINSKNVIINNKSNNNNNDGEYPMVKESCLNDEILKEFHKNDQLDIFLSQLKKFSIKEGKVNFLPTFRYVVKTDCYEISKRHISWTDRILFKNSKYLEQIMYNRGEINISDHRPVFSLFNIKLK